MTLEASKISAAAIEKSSQPVQKPQKIVEKPKKSGGNLKNTSKQNREIIPIFKISEMKSVYSVSFTHSSTKSVLRVPVWTFFMTPSLISSVVGRTEM